MTTGVKAYAVTIVVATGWALAVVALAQRPAAVQTFPADRATPETIVVRGTFPAAGLVCAAPETDGGTVACRTAAEFRAWVRAPRKREELAAVAARGGGYARAVPVKWADVQARDRLVVAHVPRYPATVCYGERCVPVMRVAELIMRTGVQEAGHDE